MRITESISARNLLNDVNMLNEKLELASEQASSGKKILHLHDAPADSSEMLQLKNQLSQLDQYQTNADTSSFFLQVSESSLNSLYNLVTSVYSNGSAAINDFNDANARSTYAAEIGSQLDQIFSLANTQVRGRYIFSGSQVTAPAFTRVGDGAQYQGDTEINTVDIGNALQVQMNIPGSTVFDPVFTAASALKAAVEQGDQDAMKSALGQFSTALATVNQVRTRLGVDLTKIQDSATARQQQQTDIQSRQSHIGDADMASVITQVNQIQTALQATFSVGSLLGKKNLFDYLA